MDKLRVQLEQIGGCGDGGCMIHVRPGMHTNGGCRCSTDPLKMRQTVRAYKVAVEEQEKENLQLRAVLNMAGQHLCRQKPTPARTIIIGAIRAKLRGEEVDEQNC